MGFSEARECLRKFREENERKPEKVVQLFKDNLEGSLGRLGDEKWIVYEQVAIAAMDLKDWETVKTCTSALSRQYPGSERVKRLKAMRLEAMEKYEEANHVYDILLATDNTSASIHKRKIAILKAQGNRLEAIEQLCDYVKKFQSDQEGWMELCHLYIEEGDFCKAGFCMEELILHQPHNHLFHQRYAELLYLQDTTESVEMSRSYFAYALKLNPHNMEALLGFYSAASFLSTSQKLTPQKKTENKKYLDWAAEQIKTLYKKKVGPIEGKEPAVEDLMAKLTIGDKAAICAAPSTPKKEKKSQKGNQSPQSHGDNPKTPPRSPKKRAELEETIPDSS